MGAHRREISDTRMPLRQSEQNFACEYAHELQEIRIETSPSPPTSNRSNNCNGDIKMIQHISVYPPNDSIEVEQNKRRKKMVGNGGKESMFNRSFRVELLKTAVAFLCLMVSAFLNFFLLTIIHDIVPQNSLPDLTFMIIEQQKWAWSVGDVLSTINAVFGFTFILLHHKRVLILRRVFLLAAILYGLRAVVLGVTYLPPSFKDKDRICQPKLNGTSMYATEIATRFVTYVVTLGLTSGQPQILCGDLMFSGHTVVLTIMYFTQLYYTPRGLWLIRWIVTPITFLGIAALVVSGGHYTMDVLIAYWLTSHVFWSYHQVFGMPHEQRASAPLSRLWWFWLCWWFEAGVPDGPIRNVWNWPFPRPAFLHSIMEKLNSLLR